MAILLGIPLLAILTVLQSVILNDWTLLDGRPDLVLLAVISWAIVGRPREAMIWGFLGGLFLDLLSGAPFGTSAIILISIAFLVSFSEGRFWEAHFLMPLGATLVASFLFHGASLLLLWALGQPMDPILAITRVILPSTFLNLLLALPATQLTESLSKALYPPEIEI
jgi:rod shape-determining protein MreD